MDKVLAHKSTSTLTVVAVGLAGLGLFNAVLQYLRSYALSHTTNRIDVELGAKLFHHLLRLPLGYFETRAAGQTVARMRELETIRGFLTGQGLSSVLDLLFAAVFVVLNIMLSWLIVRPIRRMSEAADKVSTGNFGVPEFKEKGRDEVAVLGSSFNRMRRSLEKAMQMIGEH